MASFWISVLCSGGILILSAIWIWKRREDKVLKLPRYRGFPVIGNLFQVNRYRPELTFTEWAKDLGPVFSVKILNRQVVVLSSFDAIHETLVEKGHDFASRSTKGLFRVDLLSNGARGITFMEPTPTWRKLRKVCHKKIKMYDSGMKRIAELNNAMIENVVENFKKKEMSFNPKDIIFNAVMNTILALLLGKTYSPDDEIFKLMMQFEHGIKQSLSATGTGVELDICPWLRFFGNETYKLILGLKDIRRRVWELVTEEASFGDQSLAGDEDDVRLVTALKEVLTEKDSGLSEELLKTIVVGDLAFAGFTTTANTLYIYLSIIGQHPDIQAKLQEEVDRLVGPDRCVCLADKEDMHYAQATMFELLRYTTVAPFPPPHMSSKDTTIQGNFIPAGVNVIINLYALHHDEDFWKNPYDFQPERFLDENNQLLSALHPNRRHLMSFGGGPRGCIGEVLTKSRLFLIMCSLAQKFNIRPGEVTATCDPKLLQHGIVLSSAYFEIIAEERK